MDSIGPTIWILWIRLYGLCRSDDIDDMRTRAMGPAILTLGDIDDMDSVGPTVWILWVRRC